MGHRGGGGKHIRDGKEREGEGEKGQLEAERELKKGWLPNVFFLMLG